MKIEKCCSSKQSIVFCIFCLLWTKFPLCRLFGSDPTQYAVDCNRNKNGPGAEQKETEKMVCSENTFCYSFGNRVYVCPPSKQRKSASTIAATVTVLTLWEGGGGGTLSRRPVTKTAVPFPRRMSIGQVAWFTAQRSTLG